MMYRPCQGRGWLPWTRRYLQRVRMRARHKNPAHPKHDPPPAQQQPPTRRMHSSRQASRAVYARGRSRALRPASSGRPGSRRQAVASAALAHRRAAPRAARARAGDGRRRRREAHGLLLLQDLADEVASRGAHPAADLAAPAHKDEGGHLGPKARASRPAEQQSVCAPAPTAAPSLRAACVDGPGPCWEGP
jgi:hypothetical protein